MRDANGWYTRFPPSAAALTACREVVGAWQQDQGITMNLEEPTWKLAARVGSWIGPKSVVAGVGDVIGGRVGRLNVPSEALDLLGEQLARRLLADDLLGRKPEKPATPAASPLDFGPGTKA